MKTLKEATAAAAKSHSAAVNAAPRLIVSERRSLSSYSRARLGWAGLGSCPGDRHRADNYVADWLTDCSTKQIRNQHRPLPLPPRETISHRLNSLRRDIYRRLSPARREGGGEETGRARVVVDVRGWYVQLARDENHWQLRGNQSHETRRGASTPEHIRHFSRSTFRRQTELICGRLVMYIVITVLFRVQASGEYIFQQSCLKYRFLNRNVFEYINKNFKTLST